MWHVPVLRISTWFRLWDPAYNVRMKRMRGALKNWGLCFSFSVLHWSYLSLPAPSFMSVDGATSSSFTKNLLINLWMESNRSPILIDSCTTCIFVSVPVILSGRKSAVEEARLSVLRAEYTPLLLEERDFIPGEDHLTNMRNAIQNSQKPSVWCLNVSWRMVGA